MQSSNPREHFDAPGDIFVFAFKGKGWQTMASGRPTAGETIKTTSIPPSASHRQHPCNRQGRSMRLLAWSKVFMRVMRRAEQPTVSRFPAFISSATGRMGSSMGLDSDLYGHQHCMPLRDCLVPLPLDLPNPCTATKEITLWVWP